MRLTIEIVFSDIDKISIDSYCATIITTLLKFSYFTFRFSVESLYKNLFFNQFNLPLTPSL